MIYNSDDISQVIFLDLKNTEFESDFLFSFYLLSKFAAAKFEELMLYNKKKVFCFI